MLLIPQYEQPSGELSSCFGVPTPHINLRQYSSVFPGAATAPSTILAQAAAWTLKCLAQQLERKELGHMEPELVLGGVIPANLMAFDAGLEIDERNYRQHIRYLVDTPGVTGLTTNAHAS